MATFHLDVVTPSRKVFSDDVELVTVPTASGVAGILPHHMPLVSLLKEGEIKITTKDKDFYMAIGEGFMEVGKNGVQILVSRAYKADELNETEIQKAQQAAREILTKKVEETERMEAYATLRRSVLQMKVLSHRKVARQRVSSMPQQEPIS